MDELRIILMSEDNKMYYLLSNSEAREIKIIEVNDNNKEELETKLNKNLSLLKEKEEDKYIFHYLLYREFFKKYLSKITCGLDINKMQELQLVYLLLQKKYIVFQLSDYADLLYLPNDYENESVKKILESVKKIEPDLNKYCECGTLTLERKSLKGHTYGTYNNINDLDNAFISKENSSLKK